MTYQLYIDVTIYKQFVWLIVLCILVRYPGNIEIYVHALY